MLSARPAPPSEGGDKPINRPNTPHKPSKQQTKAALFSVNSCGNGLFHLRRSFQERLMSEESSRCWRDRLEKLALSPSEGGDSAANQICNATLALAADGVV